jgi:hypothetical protein
VVGFLLLLAGCMALSALSSEKEKETKGDKKKGQGRGFAPFSLRLWQPYG